MDNFVKAPVDQGMRQLHANVAQLLEIEQHTTREKRKTKDELIHAAKMAAIGRMVAGVNHEIKRPLASMRLLAENSSELLAQGHASLVADNLQMLVRIMDQLDRLSRQLEGFSRKTPLKYEAVSLRDIIAGAVAIAAPQLQTSGGRVDAQVDDLRVFGDRDRLTLVLVNLVSNGLDAMTERDQRTIEIRAFEAGDEVVLSVRDHGTGLSAAVLEHLFEPFFTTKAPGKGLGMGLALSSEVVEEMGGKLSGRNHPGGGAQFSISLLQA